MGIIGDRTQSKYGKFRPWILWTALPLAAILSLLFTAPELSDSGKIIYAYITYIFFTLIYTANNIPYGALMGVITGDDKQRTSLGSYRMAGAFAGGMLVQGALLFLVNFYGDINPEINLKPLSENQYSLEISSPKDIEHVNINTKDGIALFTWDKLDTKSENLATTGKSIAMEADKKYNFIISGVPGLKVEDLNVINQKQGYSYSMYLMSAVLALLMLITFASTKERVKPPKSQKSNLKRDFKDLIQNKPWIILLVIGLLFNIYNSIKQGIVIIYFTHYLGDQLLSASYLVGLMIASIIGAFFTAPLSAKFGKKNLFIGALIFSSLVNAALIFANQQDINLIFGLGILSEFGAAIFPTLFFVMLGDAADYSEWKNGRRATGLIYSAGSFATKFGGGIAGAIIGLVLGYFAYDGMDRTAIEGAFPGIVMLMSWVPSVVALIAAALMTLYPLSSNKMRGISLELQEKRRTNSYE